RFAVAVQSYGMLRDQHPRAELLRLIVRARRQLLPRDAERKAEVILDLGARAGLTTRCVGFDDHDIQPFRCRVHRRPESRGTGADDHHVPDFGAIERGVQAEAVGELLHGRILEHEAAAANHDRDVGGREMEPVAMPCRSSSRSISSTSLVRTAGIRPRNRPPARTERSPVNIPGVKLMARSFDTPIVFWVNASNWPDTTTKILVTG